MERPGIELGDELKGALFGPSDLDKQIRNALELKLAAMARTSRSRTQPYTFQNQHKMSFFHISALLSIGEPPAAHSSLAALRL